jgi:hypothetical protein
MKPLKGVHLELTESVLGFLQEQKGELRVGVVLTKKNELKIDIRPWGDY